MKRRSLLMAFGAAFATPLASFAQPQGKIRRIGFLAARSRSTPANPDVYYDAFAQGMRSLGYVEGKNIVIEWRFADGKLERLPELAAELVRLKVELIATHGTQNAQAAQRATSTIPIVVSAIADPVSAGVVKSLARPGGNVTGLSLMTTDLSPKQIELLHAVIPKLSRVALLMNTSNSGHAATLKSTQAAAQTIGARVLPVEVRSAEEIERGFATVARKRSNVLIVAADTFLIGQRRQIVELAMKHRIPTMHSYREDVEAGALISYGQNLADFYRHAAAYVDKILKGAKPAEMPIEQPFKIHLAINLKTAKALGLAVSKDLRFRADEVFE